MDQLIGTSPGQPDSLLDKSVRRAVLDGNEEYLRRALGDNWRAEAASIHSIATALIIRTIYAHKVMPPNVTLGDVWDYVRTRQAMPPPQATTSQREWQKNTGIRLDLTDPFKLLRTLSIARQRGISLSDLYISSVQMRKIGSTPTKNDNIRQRLGVPVTHLAANPYGHPIETIIFPVDKLLDWFLENNGERLSDYTHPYRFKNNIISRSALLRRSNRYPLAKAGDVQQLWSYYYQMLHMAHNSPDVHDTSKRVFVEQCAHVLTVLSEYDPDWRHQEYDPLGIRTDMYYLVWCPPPPEWRTDIVHTPLGLNRFQVIDRYNPERYVLPSRSRNAVFVQTGIVVFIKGEKILENLPAFVS